MLNRQHGLITTAQALELGISSSTLSKRTRRGEFERVLPRVWRSTLVVPSLQQKALAAVLFAGEDSVASHGTAARLFGARDAGSLPHVWSPNQRQSDLVVVHRGLVAQNDRRIRDGVPVTGPARTLVDLAAVLDDEQLEIALEHFLHHGLTTPMSINRCLDAIGGTGRAGSARLRALLADRDARPLESPLEVKVWRLLRRAGLKPVRQFEVTCGNHRYRLDFAWPKLKVAIEADGFAAHDGRRAFVADRRRLAELAAAGWIVIPLTWDDCAHPEVVVQRVRAALLRAA